MRHVEFFRTGDEFPPVRNNGDFQVIMGRDKIGQRKFFEDIGEFANLRDGAVSFKGRPAVFALSIQELEKRFGRT